MNYEEYLFFLFLIFLGVYLVQRGHFSETRIKGSLILFVALSLARIIFGLFFLFFAYSKLLFLGVGSEVTTKPADMFFAVVAGILIAWARGKTTERRV